MNQPYVKRFDDQGVLLNPIKKTFVSPYPNRQTRRKKEVRFLSNRKGAKLTVHGQFAFHRVLQVELDRDGNQKYIMHYLPKKH